jgi:hypothetical protein
VKWAVEVAMDLSIKGREKSQRVVKAHLKWQYPEAGNLKLNVDASFLGEAGEGASG